MPFSSKYRHVYGVLPKPEWQYLDLKAPYTSGEGSYCHANDKFFAVAKSGGGGPVYINPLDNVGRLNNMKVVNVQKGKVLDFKFHPFIPNLIGTASEDCSFCVTEFPEKGLSENIGQATLTLKGHQKKCHLMNWHPTANNIVCTSSWDKTIKLWDIETQHEVNNLVTQDATFSVEWNHDGSLLAWTDKSRSLTMHDPRVKDGEMKPIECMAGKKSSKLFWVPTYNWIGMTGFTAQAKRCIRMWDLKNMDKPIYDQVIDQQASVLMPVYDEDTHVLYTFGKGDVSVNYYECVNDNKKLQPLGVYRGPEPQKGGAFVPKRAMDTKKCEVMRFLKLTRNSVLPISMVVPRKAGADIFQSDIFPDCVAGLPSMTSTEYLAGENKPPVRKSMDPEKSGGASEQQAATLVKKMTYAELSTQNEALKDKIAKLQAALRTAGVTDADLVGEAACEAPEEEKQE